MFLTTVSDLVHQVRLDLLGWSTHPMNTHFLIKRKDEGKLRKEWVSLKKEFPKTEKW